MYNTSYLNQNGSEGLRAIPYHQKDMTSRLDIRKVPNFIPNNVNRALSIIKSGQLVNSNFSSRFVDSQEKLYVEDHDSNSANGSSESGSVCSSLSSSFSSISPTSTPLSYEAFNRQEEIVSYQSSEESSSSSTAPSSLSSSSSSLSPHALFTTSNKDSIWSSLLYTPSLHPSLFNSKNNEGEIKLNDSTINQYPEYNYQYSNMNVGQDTVSYNNPNQTYNGYPNDYLYYAPQTEYYNETEEPVYYYDSNTYSEFYPEMPVDNTKPVYTNYYQNYSTDCTYYPYYEQNNCYSNPYNRNMYPTSAYNYNKNQHYPNTLPSYEKKDEFYISYEEMNRKVNDIVDNEALLMAEGNNNTNMDMIQSMEAYEASKYKLYRFDKTQEHSNIPEHYTTNYHNQQFYNKTQFNEQNYKTYPMNQMSQFVPNYPNKPYSYNTYETTGAEVNYQENNGLKKSVNAQNFQKPGAYFSPQKQQQQQQNTQQQTPTINFAKRGKNPSQFKTKKKYCKCVYNCTCGPYSYANEAGVSAAVVSAPNNSNNQLAVNTNNTTQNPNKYRYRTVSKSRA